MLLLAVYIVHELIIILLGSMVVAYLIYPLYRWLLRKTKRETLSSLTTIFIMVMVLVIPAVFMVNAFIREAWNLYLYAQKFLNSDTSGTSVKLICENNPLCGVFSSLGFGEDNFLQLFSIALEKMFNTLNNVIFETLASIPQIFFNFFIALFLIHYFLKDGKSVIRYVKSIIPLDARHVSILTTRFSDVSYAVIYGNIVVAVLQGALTSLGFFIFSAPSPIIWGFVTVFTSLVPFLGAAFVWVPACVFLIISGYNSGDSFLIINGAGLALFGFFIISGIDNIIKPKLIGNRADLHPALVLIGVIGGLGTLGFIGLLIGPVVVALATTGISILRNKNSYL